MYLSFLVLVPQIRLSTGCLVPLSPMVIPGSQDSSDFITISGSPPKSGPSKVLGDKVHNETAFFATRKNAQIWTPESTLNLPSDG